MRQQGRIDLILIPHMRRHFGWEEAGNDRIDGDVTRRQIAGQIARHHMDCSLARGIAVRAEPLCLHPRDRTDVDHPRRIASLSGRAEFGEEFPDHGERRLDVHGLSLIHI